jgi:hypothetical protein
MNMAALPLLWANCVNLLKDRVNNRSFWEALEATRPVTIEGNTLVIGLRESEYSRVGYLEQSANMNAIVKAVQERFNAPLQVRIIEGQTLADWEAIKSRDQRIAVMRQQEIAPRHNEPVVQDGTWEGLADALSQLYSISPFRNLPQGKARFANDALYALAEAMDTLYPEDPDETTERNLARALERISGYADIPATVLAFELERLVAWRRSQAPAEEEAEGE